MTLALGHEHFSRSRFRSLVSGAFPEARFGSFEAHYVPGLRRLALQHAVEEALERLVPFRSLLAHTTSPSPGGRDGDEDGRHRRERLRRRAGPGPA